MPTAAWALGALVATYLALGWLFARETQVRGLLSPGGTPNLDVVAIGGAYLLVRVAVRFGVPLVAVLAVTRPLIARFAARRSGS